MILEPLFETRWERGLPGGITYIQLPLLQNSAAFLPTNLQTTIRYALNEPSAVRLEVYDVLGNRITTLVNAVAQPSGNHAIIWDCQRESGAEFGIAPANLGDLDDKGTADLADQEDVRMLAQSSL